MALALLHRARAIAASLAFCAALIFLLGFRAGETDGAAPLILAPRALAAAAMAARPAALILLLGFGGAVPSPDGISDPSSRPVRLAADRFSLSARRRVVIDGGSN
jgi:hypothetical protein